MTEAGRPDLLRFFRPRAVAVVGAHDTRPGLAQFTRAVLDRAELVGAAFHPVNPKLETVFGVPTVAALADVAGPLDLLVILTGNPEAVLEQARTLRPAFTLVFADGFAELGTPEGRAREERLVELALAAGTRLIGPNTNANGLEVLDDNEGPKIALVTQSGGHGRAVTQAQELGVAFSWWAPTGNEADLGAADFIEFFAENPETAAICAYIEGIRSGDRLRRAAVAAIEHDTPITLVKIGRSDTGAAMAASHTGHLVGSDPVWDAFFEQYGITRVDDLDELLEVSVALARSPRPPAAGVVVACPSGGSASHLADLAHAAGLELPTLRPDIQAALHEVIPAGLAVSNPVDNGGIAMMAGHGPRIVELCLADPAIGLLMFPITPLRNMIEVMGESLIKGKEMTDKPIFVIWSAPTTTHPVYRELWDAGLPVFSNYRNAITAAKALLRRTRTAELAEVAALARQLPPLRPIGGGRSELLDEADATGWLQDRGFAFAPAEAAADADGAVAVAARLGYPVVLKARGPAHRSELGLVATGLSSGDEVAATAARFLAADDVTGLIVARQVTGGIELLAGVTRDPVLGPVVVVGSGGVTAEALADVSRSVLPLTRARAGTMLDRLRIAPLLRGWRGSPPVDREAIIDTLLRLADLAGREPVAEIDINPLLARPDGVVGLDALVRLEVAAQ